MKAKSGRHRRVARAAAVGAPSLSPLVALLLVGWISGCSGARGTIELTVTAAPESELLAQLDRVRLTLTSPGLTVERSRAADGSFALALDVDAQGQLGQVIFEGFDDAGELIAYGRTPPLPIAAIDAAVTIYVAPPLSVRQAPATLLPPRDELGTAALAYGAALVGGRLADGSPSAAMSIYNAYDHAMQEEAPLPEARRSMLALAGANGDIYAFGGLDASAAARAEGWRYVPSAGGYVALMAEPSLARAGAAGAPLGGERFVIAGDPLLVLDGLASSITPLPEQPAQLGAVASSRTGRLIDTLFADSSGLALLSGGELVAVDAPSDALRTGHAIVVLPGGDFLILGGSDATGPVASAVRVEPRNRAATSIASVLATPRRDAAIAATGELIAIAGGTLDDGTVAGDVELIDAVTLAPLKREPLIVARTGAAAVALPSGHILIAGGTDASGAPVAVLELVTPSAAALTP